MKLAVVPTLQQKVSSKHVVEPALILGAATWILLRQILNCTAVTSTISAFFLSLLSLFFLAPAPQSVVSLEDSLIKIYLLLQLYSALSRTPPFDAIGFLLAFLYFLSLPMRPLPGARVAQQWLVPSRSTAQERFEPAVVCLGELLWQCAHDRPRAAVPFAGALLLALEPQHLRAALSRWITAGFLFVAMEKLLAFLATHTSVQATQTFHWASGG